MVKFRMCYGHTGHIFQTHTMRSVPIYHEILKSNQEDFSGGFFCQNTKIFNVNKQTVTILICYLKLIINMIIVNMQFVQTLTQLSNFAIVKT